MTRYAPQWLQDQQYAASMDRRLIGAMWPNRSTKGHKVSAAGTGMDLNISAGQSAVPTYPWGTDTGTVLCTSDGVETVTLDPAPPSGTDRYDRVYVMPRGTDLDGGPDNDFIFAVANGGAVPAGGQSLALILIHGGVATITDADITDERAESTRGFPLAVDDPPYYLSGQLAADVPLPAPNTPYNVLTPYLPEGLWLCIGAVTISNNDMTPPYGAGTAWWGNPIDGTIWVAGGQGANWMTPLNANQVGGFTLNPYALYDVVAGGRVPLEAISQSPGGGKAVAAGIYGVGITGYTAIRLGHHVHP